MRVGEAAHMPAVVWNKWAGKGSVQFHSSAGFFIENPDILNWCPSRFKAGTWIRKLMQVDFHPCFQLGKKNTVCTLVFLIYGIKTGEENYVCF